MGWGSKNTYAKTEILAWPNPNIWDAVAIFLVLFVLSLIGYGAGGMLGKLQSGSHISLSPYALPYYALRTVLRMFLAMSFSVLFTFIFGTWAAKHRIAGRFIIPAVDILQSVPILGFLSIAVPVFTFFFRTSLFGAECAAIFAIFTAQVWNMILSFYQSLSNVPSDMCEVADVFQLSGWQRFWRIDVPFAMPGLLWNAMISMSGSWVFLVAAEVISVGNQQILLPGIGSYIMVAIEQANIVAVVSVILMMLLVIALYDQLLFRPLVAWAGKFRSTSDEDDEQVVSWVLRLFQRTHLLRFVLRYFSLFADWVVSWPLFRRRPVSNSDHSAYFPNRVIAKGGKILMLIMLIVLFYFLAHFILLKLDFHETFYVLHLGLITGLRVISATIVSSIIWVPVGVWVGLHPKVSRVVQPVAQFLAAFPVNLLFPLAVMFIVHFSLNVNIWVSPLMILGTQWYILFNIVAGTTMLPKHLRHVAGILNLRGWLWWKRFILPGIFPYYITGAVAAAGGAWNMSIIAEALNWGDTHLRATGLGSYIAKVAAAGHFSQVVLSIIVMALYVWVLNRFVWHPLYRLAARRFQVNV